MIDINVTDNTGEVLSAFKQQVLAGLTAVGLSAEGHAKENCPVDTGRLRNSIAFAVHDDEVYIGTNVEYAPYVEYRDISHKTGQAHFLRDAATTHGDEYQELVETALKS